MLHLIPPPLHRALYRLAHHMRKVWLRVNRSTLYGCSVIAVDGEGRVLLVRHSYGAPVWAFPGGGMRPSESPEAAALREFAEELGASISDPQHLGTLQEIYLGTVNIAHVFTGPLEGEATPDMRELVEARFFHRHELPGNISGTVMARLELLEMDLQQR